MIDDINDKIWDITIIGAGAAGLMAALAIDAVDLDVLVLESGERVGKKLLSTGNGKCNLSNYDFTLDKYYGSVKDISENLFERFNVEDTLSFFKNLGLLTRDRDGYIYPFSEQAASVLDIMRFEIDRRNNIKLLCNHKVSDIKVVDDLDNIYSISCAGDLFKSRTIICAAGALAAPKTGSDGSVIEILKGMGVSITSMVPALVKCKSNSSDCKAIDGVRAKGIVSLIIDDKKTGICENGEIQFTKDGLSGIPIFNISRHISYALKDNKPVTVSIDLMPNMSEEDVFAYIFSCCRKKCRVEEALAGIVNKKLNNAILKNAGISINDITDKVPEHKLRDYCFKLKHWNFNIVDIYGYDYAQICAGGVSSSSLTSKLELKDYPGIFVAGEIADIDGVCGGYNLQWAWTSGNLSAKYAQEYINNYALNS